MRRRYWYRNTYSKILLVFFTAMSKKIIPFFSLLCLITLFSACKKEYSVETGITNVDATGSLKDTLGNCMPATVLGTFYNGVTPYSDTAQVEEKANVDTQGR